MIRAIALAAVLGSLGHAALAQSAYGCEGLDAEHAFASVEGSDGVFYRIDPDLHMFHPFADGTVAQLAALSQALEGQGTTLIYVPVPTRALAMPANLPPRARDLGYDAAVAATLYDDMVTRLADAGVRAVDARRALLSRAGEPLSFLRADPRLTPEGGRRLARALADAIAQSPDFAALPKGRFDPRSQGRAPLESRMRSVLQRHCLGTLPDAEVEVFASVGTVAARSAIESAIADAIGSTGSVVLVGTDITGDETSNLSGFVAQATGLQVESHAVEGGGSFAAISSYLVSDAFRETRPSVLVWLNPIANGLANHGDQPMRELIAAAGDACRTELAAGPGADPSSLVVDLSNLDPTRPATILVDTGGAPARMARFDFATPDGLVRSRTVLRDAAQAATSRFHMPTSGLGDLGARAVAVTFDAPLGAGARAAACLD